MDQRRHEGLLTESLRGGERTTAYLCSASSDRFPGLEQPEIAEPCSHNWSGGIDHNPIEPMALPKEKGGKVRIISSRVEQPL